MEIRSYNRELHFANALFRRLFNNIVIDKTINNKRVEVPVNCIIGNRSRVFKNLENPDKAGIPSLPLIVITRNSITRNTARLANVHNEVVNSASSKQINYDLLAPVPIDIEYTVTVITKDPDDNNRIVSNFLPFFNGDLYIRSQHPKFENVAYHSQVIIGDTIMEEHPEELDNNVDDIQTSTFSFTLQTYIFGGSSRVPLGPRTVITPVVSTFISNDVVVSVDTEISTIYDGFTPNIQALCLDFHVVPFRDPLILSDFVRYDINKYFDDVNSGRLADPDYDLLRWSIDENGVYTNVSHWIRNDEHQPNQLIGQKDWPKV